MTVRSKLERESGEVKIISKSSIGNVLHKEGKRLVDAQVERAKAVINADGKAKKLLGRAAAHLVEDYFEEVYLNGADLEHMTCEEVEQLFYQVEWDPYEEYEEYEEMVKTKRREQQSNRRIDQRNLKNCKELLEPAKPEVAELPMPIITPNSQLETTPTSDNPSVEQSQTSTATASAPLSRLAEIAEQVIAQVDEVVVRKQPGSKRDKIVHYNGVIKTSQRSYYCSGITSAQLIYQMGSILAQLEMHKNNKRLLVLSDCASWINNWVNGIGIKDKEAVMCWHHLRDRCRGLIGEAFTNKTDRDEVRKVILKYLWRGRTDEALSYLRKLIEDVEDGCSKLGVKSVREIETVRDYMIKRRAYIVDYQRRVKNREWIASTQVEKFNDFSVAIRCKKENGMRWSSAGVEAIAALEVARRNGELESWRESGKFPSWKRLLTNSSAR